MVTEDSVATEGSAVKATPSAAAGKVLAKASSARDLDNTPFDGLLLL